MDQKVRHGLMPDYLAGQLLEHRLQAWPWLHDRLGSPAGYIIGVSASSKLASCLLILWHRPLDVVVYASWFG
jgi:hypothetical protein